MQVASYACCWDVAAKRDSADRAGLHFQVEYLLNTGIFVSNSTLDFSQATGFTVVAEKLNFFRCGNA